jgi:hypothetical protein
VRICKRGRKRTFNRGNGRDANHGPPAGDVVDNDRPGPYPDTVADLHALAYNGTRPYEYTFSGDHIPANGGSRHHARKSSELAVVPHRREIGDERMSTESGHRRNVSVAQHYGPSPQVDSDADVSPGMDDRGCCLRRGAYPVGDR